MTTTLAQHSIIDQFEREALDHPSQMYYKLDHEFLPCGNGQYIYARTAHVPKGCLFSSLEHKTLHHFNLSKGVNLIYGTGKEPIRLIAPCRGTTEPGTRRLIFAEEDSIMTTYHLTTETDPEAVLAEITAPSRNPLLSEEDKLRMQQHRISMPSSREELPCPE